MWPDLWVSDITCLKDALWIFLVTFLILGHLLFADVPSLWYSFKYFWDILPYMYKDVSEIDSYIYIYIHLYTQYVLVAVLRIHQRLHYGRSFWPQMFVASWHWTTKTARIDAYSKRNIGLLVAHASGQPCQILKHALGTGALGSLWRSWRYQMTTWKRNTVALE